MNRLVGTLALALGLVQAGAQSLDHTDLQLHGFAVQSFVRSGSNNYLGLNSSAGSTQWTEAAVNVNDQVSDKLRVGVQFHLTRLGAFGGDGVTVDWALGDYSMTQWLGVRAGKVKIRWGLFNDTQDADPGYLWSLLPEPVYGIDQRATNLAQYGAELYGRVPLGKKLGTLDYSAYYGDYFYASNDGYAANFTQQGLTFVSQPGGKTPGFDLRWSTPLHGLMLGGSLMMYDANGTLTNGTFNQPLAFWPTYYAQYNHKKLFADWQYVKLVQYQTVTLTGTSPVTSVQDTRSWFVMAGYHVTNKLQLGTYYTRYVDASATDRSDPANYFHDTAISARYDVDLHFYLKAEGHFIRGNGLGFYSQQNPNSLQPNTNMVVAKAGFTF
jgi:hypothetical protein